VASRERSRRSGKRQPAREFDGKADFGQVADMPGARRPGLTQFAARQIVNPVEARCAPERGKVDLDLNTATGI